MKLLTVLTLILAINSNVFASSRTDDAIYNASEVRLNKIDSLKSDLKKLDAQRSQVNKDLVEALNKNKNQKVFLKVRNAAVVGTAVAIPIGVGIATGDTVMSIVGIALNGMPSKVSVGGAAAVAIGVVGAVVIVGAETGVLLNRNEAKNLVSTLESLKRQISITNHNLDKEVGILCKTETRHQLCY